MYYVLCLAILIERKSCFELVAVRNARDSDVQLIMREDRKTKMQSNGTTK